LPRQGTPASEALLLDSTSHALAAPHIFPAEIRNVLLMLERRRRLTRDETHEAMSLLSSLGINIEPPPAHTAYDAILDLARDEQLTVYDAIYLWNAMREGYTLASRDADLLAAASRNAVAIEDLRA
jgi:predicted nucleic acid-binding protein